MGSGELLWVVGREFDALTIGNDDLPTILGDEMAIIHIHSSCDIADTAACLGIHNPYRNQPIPLFHLPTQIDQTGRNHQSQQTVTEPLDRSV